MCAGEAGTTSFGGSLRGCKHDKGCDVHDTGDKFSDASLSHQRSQPCVASGRSAAKPSAQMHVHWFAAAKSGHLPSLRSALASDEALLKCKGPGVGHTALHWAAAGGHVPAVRWLVAMGLSASTVNAVGSTALHAAAAHGQADVLLELLDGHSCSQRIVNDDGDTALQVLPWPSAPCFSALAWQFSSCC